MGAIATRARTELRRRWRSALLLVLAIGIAAGATLAAFAGARRTDSAVDRFVAYARPAQGVVIGDPDSYARIKRLPQLAASTLAVRMLLARLDAHEQPGAVGASQIAIADANFSRALVLAGRAPRPDRVDEVAVNPSAAAHLHLRVGSMLRLRAFAPAQSTELLRGTRAAPTGPTVTVRVVGIERALADLSAAQAAPGVLYASNDSVLFTPAFLDRYRDRVATAGVLLVFRLRDGASQLPSFRAAVGRLTAGKAGVFPGSDDLTAAAQARHATSVEALALLLFGLLGGVVTLTLIAQALARQVHVDAEDYPTLRAMGATRTQFAAGAAIRAALIASVGAALAVAVAIAASPHMPIGLARQAEVGRGYSIDGFVLLTGSFVIITLLTGWTAAVAWRAADQAGKTPNRRTMGSRRSSRIARALSRTGSPASATVGATMAFESGRGTAGVPVRTTLLSAVLAVTVVAGALTFGANLSRLAAHPRLQGWNWDVAVGNPHSDDVAKTAIPLLAGNPTIAAISAIAGPEGVPARIDGHDAGVFGIDAVKGPGLVPYFAGRAPRTPNEIALATKTMREAHLGIGQRVRLSTGGPPRSMRVTGRMLLTPSVVNDSVPLGEGIVVSDAALRALHTDAPVNVFLVRFRAGVDRPAALTRLRTQFPGTVLTAVRPPDIENLRRVDRLPTLLATLFALVALLTVGNTLVSSVRRRRRELAILRTVGFVRRQVAATIAWQATAVAIVALGIGVPLGVAAGRSTWTLVTDRLGLPANAVVPANVLLALGLLSLAAANLVALVPGLLASRTTPATILRAE